MIEGHAAKRETIRHPLSNRATRATLIFTLVTHGGDQQTRKSNQSPIRLLLPRHMGLFYRSRYEFGGTLLPLCRLLILGAGLHAFFKLEFGVGQATMRLSGPP
jgi:hypothetical protein